MKIKKYLREVGVTQKEFAIKLGLSRPTLDTYIEMYESEQMISKEKYQIAFDTLFNEELSKTEFLEELKRLSYLLKRDSRYGTSEFSPEASDTVSRIIESMKEDMNKDDWDEDAYIFVNSFIQSYRSNKILYNLSKYFIYINMTRDLEEIEEEQIPYFANFYKFFRDMLSDEFAYNKQDYVDFLARCEQLSLDRDTKRTNKIKRIEELLSSKLIELENKGVSVSESELVDMVKRDLL